MFCKLVQITMKQFLNISPNFNKFNRSSKLIKIITIEDRTKPIINISLNVIRRLNL